MTLEEVEAILSGAPRIEGTRGRDETGDVSTSPAECVAVDSVSSCQWSSNDARIEVELSRENVVVRCKLVLFHRDEASFLDTLRGWLGLGTDTQHHMLD
jgi:hypothetical protein